MVRNQDWLDTLVRMAMAEVQANAVPVINRLLAEAQRAPRPTTQDASE